MTKSYQQCFNEALSKMRIATSAIIMDNEPLMRTLVKIMYDFSDDLKFNNLVKDKDEDGRKQIKEF